MEFRKMVTITLYVRGQKEAQMYRTVVCTLWEREKVGWNAILSKTQVILQLVEKKTDGYHVIIFQCLHFSPMIYMCVYMYTSFLIFESC